MINQKSNTDELNAADHKVKQHGRLDADEAITVTLRVTPIASQKLMPVISTFIITVATTACLGIYVGKQAEPSLRPTINFTAPATLPLLHDRVAHTPLTLELIKGYAESQDETYMDTVIRYLATPNEQVDTARLEVKVKEVSSEYASKGYNLDESFLQKIALNRLYKETLHLATGNYTYETIRAEVDANVPLYISYFVLLNDNADVGLLASVNEILQGQSTVQAIEAKLSEAELWGELKGHVSYNTPNYMEDSFTEITAVNTGETIVNNYHKYVAKLLKKAPATEVELIHMYLNYLDYEDFTEVLTTYAGILKEPYSLDAELRAILHKPTDAYTTFLAKQS